MQMVALLPQLLPNVKIPSLCGFICCQYYLHRGHKLSIARLTPFLFSGFSTELVFVPKILHMHGVH